MVVERRKNKLKKKKRKKRRVADGFLLCGAYALERWLGLNCFSLSLSFSAVVFTGAPVVVDVFIPSGDARAPYIPPTIQLL